MPVGIVKIAPRDTNLQADADIVIIPFGGKMTFTAHLYSDAKNIEATKNSIKWVWVDAEHLDTLRQISQKEQFEHWENWTNKEKDTLDVYGIGIDYAKSRNVTIANISSRKDLMGKKYWLEAFIYYPEFKLPVGKYFVVKGEPAILSVYFEGTAIGKDKNLLKSKYGKVANILINTHCLPDIAAGYHNYVVFEVDIYNYEKNKKVTKEPFRSVVNFAEAPTEFNSTIKVSIILEDDWRNDTLHNTKDELRHYYAEVKAIHYYNKSADYINHDGPVLHSGTSYVGEGFVTYSANGERIGIKIEQEDWEKDSWYEKVFGHSVNSVRENAAEYQKNEIIFKSIDSKGDQLPIYVQLPYATLEDAIIDRNEVAKGLMIAEVKDQEYTCKNYDPCKFTGIDAKIGTQETVTLFDENWNASSEETKYFNKPLSFIAGDTKKENIVITLKKLTISDHQAGDGYECYEAEPHSTKKLIDPAKVNAQWLQDKTLPNPENHSTYEVKGNTIELQMRYIYNTKVAERSSVSNALLDKLWLFNYFWLTEDMGQNYVIPISTCRYPTQKVQLKVYPKISWTFHISYGMKNPYYYRDTWVEMRQHRVDDAYNKGQAGDIDGYDGDLENSFKLALECKWNETESAKLDQKIAENLKLFVGTFIKMKSFVRKVTGDDKGKSSSGLSANLLERIKRKPLSIEILSPQLSVAAGWEFKHGMKKKQQEHLFAPTINLKAQASPLVGAEAIIDLIAWGKKLHPAANAVITALDLLAYAANAEVRFDLKFYGKLVIEGDVELSRLKKSGQLKAEGQFGFELILKATATGKLKTWWTDVDYNFEASAKGGGYFAAGLALGLDNYKGPYFEPIVRHSGITITLVLKGKIGVVNRGKEKVYTIIKADKLDISKKYYIND